MADNNDVLKAIESLKSDMATKSDLEAVNNRLDGLAQGQAQLMQGQAQIKTTVEILEAGQEDICDKMATKVVIHRLEQKIDKEAKHVKSHESGIENLEEDAGIPNPHKN
jgi:uncharacterized phage infection (PIP) family protein YhgE